MVTAALTEKPVALLGEVGYEQTVQVRDYEPAKISVRVSFLFDPDDAESAVVGIRDAIFKCKTTVFEQYGKQFEISDGVARELVEDGFGRTTLVEFPPSTASGVPAEVQPDTTSSNPPHDPGPLAKPRGQMTEVEKAMDKENRAWAEARLKTHPSEFYDNRQDKASGKVSDKSPDFKHKDHKIGVWAN